MKPSCFYLSFRQYWTSQIGVIEFNVNLRKKEAFAMGSIIVLVMLAVAGMGNYKHSGRILSVRPERGLRNSEFSSLNAKSGFDSLNVRWIGAWSFGPECYAVTVDEIRNTVFMGAGGGVYVLDASDPPTNLNKLAEISTRGIVRSPFYDSGDHRLFVADGQGGLEIWDISSISSPQRMSDYFTPGYAEGVYVSGNHAYVAAGDSGLRVIDVTDPTNPHEVGHCGTPYCAHGVHVAGSYAYVADDDGGLRIIDVSDPAHPHEVGHYGTPYWDEDVYVAGSYTYVADGFAGLRIIDVSDPTDPHEVGHYNIQGGAGDIYVSGAYAYAADTCGLQVIDVSDLTDPHEAGYYGTVAHGVYVSGPYVYVASGDVGLQIYEFLPQSIGEDDGTHERFAFDLITNWNKLTFSLPTGADVRVKIYSITGRLVWTKEGYFASGRHTISLNKLLPDGVYVAVVKVRGYGSKTAKVAVIK